MSTQSTQGRFEFGSLTKMFIRQQGCLRIRFFFRRTKKTQKRQLNSFKGLLDAVFFLF